MDIPARLKELETQMADPAFWQDKARAKGLIAEYQKLKRETIEASKRPALFRGRYDGRPAILGIFAGAGGTEAADWAEMLLRMYSRFAERQGFRTSLLDVQYGSEAGIKSALLGVEGPYAFGWLRGENGVHRLIRLSPFDADRARHTSFALVEVLPEIEEAPAVAIKPDDLRIETFRASGPGGQYVQKTESAVRITHLPTKIAVSVQSERSQHQNKERALKILQAKLFRHRLTERKEELAKIRGELPEASWGHQIRSYILHPYKQIRDHRTGWETQRVEEVLDGDLEEAIRQYLEKEE